jgi:hypothetical protein
MENDLNRRKERERRERFISSPDFDPVAVLAALPEWRKRIVVINDARESFRILSAPLFSRMVEAAQKKNGKIVEIDYWSMKERWVHTIAGREWLADPRFGNKLSSAATRLREMKELLEKDRLTDDELRRVSHGAEVVLHELRSVADIIDNFERFCAPDNLRAIAQWMNNQGFEFVAVDRRGLYDTRTVTESRYRYLVEIPTVPVKLDRSILRRLNPTVTQG